MAAMHERAMARYEWTGRVCHHMQMAQNAQAMREYNGRACIR